MEEVVRRGRKPAPHNLFHLSFGDRRSRVQEREKWPEPVPLL